ncbi:MAG: hypothetical protein Q4B42_01480 [Oscillospiraceae bacterium]|nr:hypothetical protein [Oscillospiraceae bacterium]
MKSAFEKLEAFCSRWYSPFVFLLAATALIHCIIEPGSKDDAVYASYLFEHGSGLNYLISDYHAWSSRQVIESVLIYIIHFKVLWAVFDTLIFTLAAFSVSYICGTLKDLRINRWICLFALVYPFADTGTAGWVVTTVYYIWTMSLCLISIIPVAKIMRGERICGWEYPLYVLALLFSANIEFCTAILICVYGVFALIALKKKLPYKFMLAQTALLCAMMVYIFTCPGNEMRRVNETAGQFPEFDTIPLWQKFEMGYSSTWYEFIMQPNFFFLAFALLLALAVFSLNRSNALRGLSLAPLTASAAFGIVASTNSFIAPSLSLISGALTKYGTWVDTGSLKSLLPDIIITAVFASIIASFFAVFEKKADAWLCSFALLLGFGSRMTMSLSPTIWVSGSRTFIYMYFSFIVCAALIAREWLRREKGASSGAFGAALSALAVLSYLGNLYTLV